MNRDVSRADKRNIALLIDADNASPGALDSVLSVLAELGTVTIRRAYGNWKKSELKGWEAIIHSHAIEPQQQFDMVKGKSATDMKMVIDAMDLLYRGNVDGFGIMSSDCDFMPLAVRIQQEGLTVYGFGSGQTPEPFRNACTRFINVGALARGEAGGANGDKAEVDEELLNLLGDAIKASTRDEKGFASLSEVGQRAGNRSSFDVRSYGFSRLSELVESLPNFATEKRGDSVWVKRVR
jgi:uncharacterized protein (TIGR00288 family)